MREKMARAPPPPPTPLPVSLIAWTLMDDCPELSCFWEWEGGESKNTCSNKVAGEGVFLSLSLMNTESSYQTAWQVRRSRCLKSDCCQLFLQAYEMPVERVNSYLVPVNGQQIYNTPAFSAKPARLCPTGVKCAQHSFGTKPEKVVRCQRGSIEVAGN